jgi:putative copper export protein/methionine-rich copper-binding protein CopC
MAVLALIASGTFTPSRLLAHGALESSVPARGAYLLAAPRALRLTFTEKPELTFTRLRLIAPGNTPVELGSIRLESPRTVVADIPRPLVPGPYTVQWQIAGRDGHPVRGQYAFTVAPNATGLAARADTVPGEAAASVPAPGQQGPAPEHHHPASMSEGRGLSAESPPYVAIRWLTYTALLGVIGAAAFRATVLSVFQRTAAGADRDAVIHSAATNAARIGFASAAVLLAAAVLRLLAQSDAMHGRADIANPALVRAMVVSTVWGWGWVLQIVGALAALTGFLLARRGNSSGWVLAIAAAFMLAFTPALSGHAVASPRSVGLSVVADGLHVLGAGGWLGSLLVLLAAAIPTALRTGEGGAGRAVADLINAFSPTALGFAGLVALTGLVGAWINLASVPALWQSSYGRMLLLKLALLSVLAGTGAYNWRRVRPALGDIEGARRIRRSASVELAVGTLVLIATAILVALPTPTAATGSTVSARTR